MKHFLLSRTDNIGDVVLSLPLAGLLKQAFPGCTIGFLGKAYTRPVIESCPFVDYFLSEADFLEMKPGQHPIEVLIHIFPNRKVADHGRKLGIPMRIGTSRRWFHWLTCTHRVNLSRRHSPLHEAQLNARLLEPLVGKKDFSLPELTQALSLSQHPVAEPETLSFLVAGKKAVVFHPKSKGSAREWGLDNFSRLADMLSQKPDVQVYVSGSQEEGEQMRDWISAHPSVISLCGKLSLGQFIAFLSHSEGLVAASTGPLHIASALGIKAIGLFAPMDPIFPQRWAPLGPQAKVLVKEKGCEDCRKGGACACILSLEAVEVKKALGF